MTTCSLSGVRKKIARDRPPVVLENRLITTLAGRLERSTSAGKRDPLPTDFATSQPLENFVTDL